MTRPNTEDPAESARRTARRLAVILYGVGVTHFVAPKPFDKIVPVELPGSARLYTYASGVAELGTATLLLTPRTRRLGGLAAVGLFVGVFPANVNMVRLWSREPAKPLPMRIVAVARLPMQIPMITQAWRVWRDADASPAIA